MSDRVAGRSVFGEDPGGYDRARLRYPARLFELLQTRCGLRKDAAVFEIGPGTGIATRELLRLGANPLVAIEPDERLARYLRENAPSAALTIRQMIFEESSLPPASFDLGVAATSFHWLDQRIALLKVAEALKRGGWFAMWWNVFGAAHDAFFDAVDPILSRVEHPLGKSTDNFSEDAVGRITDLRAHGFANVSSERLVEPVVLDAAQTRALFSTFSPIRMLSPRRRLSVLDDIESLVRTRFGDRVTRELRTIVYTARRT